MSVFQRLRSLPIGDILHRGLLYSLVGISGWGLYTMGAVHLDILKRGRGALAAHEAQNLSESEVRIISDYLY
ncbi:hypothetical protein BDY19DRAFT_956282 [Irpex rosettiformis]|uniref:Uncharacterized protein n=1 Tax=Irpex rosettiformis TaxID=378272 RepID=A0ACB8TZ23_9APHY|nr:hypothetical protein BDY19DRAFT_956282 [Irpex rosettiformis]